MGATLRSGPFHVVFSKRFSFGPSIEFTVRRRAAGYDSWKSTNSVSALIEKRRMAPVILFCGQYFVGGGGSFPPVWKLLFTCCNV